MSDKSKAAVGKFFLRIGQVKTASERRCEWTLPLFPLPLILDADGTLAEDARHLVGAQCDGDQQRDMNKERS